MLNNYLYVHLPLNTTTLPVLSLNADAPAGEATSMQLDIKQQSVSMVTALTDAGKLPKTRSRSSTGSEDGPGLSVVTASSDRRHFWTDNPSSSLDYDGRTGFMGSSNPVERNSCTLSSSTPASPTFLSSTPPLSNVMFDSVPSDDPTTTPSSVYSTPPSSPVTTHPAPIIMSTSSKPAAVKSKKNVAGGLRLCIKNLLWRFYQFLLILFKASFVPVSGRMITLLAKEQETRSPLSNALLCFVTEVTSHTTDKSWVCNERLQLGMLSLFGRQLDR